MVVCKLCGAEVPNELLKKHIWEYHCLNYRDYFEVVKEMSDPEECWRCGSIKYPLTYIYPDIPGIPCWGCMKKKSQIENTKKQVLETLKDFQDTVLGNKYYRHLISSENSLSASLSHSLTETAGIMDYIAKNSGISINRRSEVFMFRPENLGCPMEISKRNEDSIVVDVMPVSCIKESDNSYEIIIGKRVYHLELPEIVQYETKHHQKYNILNTGKTVRNTTRRLRIGKTDKVYKFFDCYQNESSSKKELLNNQKSIFKLREKVKEEDIPHLNYIILSDKTLSGIVTEIYNEICPNLVGIFDRVFMKNYIMLSSPIMSDTCGLEMEFSLNTREISKDIMTILIWN